MSLKEGAGKLSFHYYETTAAAYQSIDVIYYWLRITAAIRFITGNRVESSFQQMVQPTP